MYYESGDNKLEKKAYFLNCDTAQYNLVYYLNRFPKWKRLAFIEMHSESGSYVGKMLTS